MTLPIVYLLGDSISAGYAPGVEAALAGLCAVRLRPENGKDSRHLLARAPEWLGGARYAAIHVNCGLHDIKRPHGNPALAVPLDEYEANLRRLIPLLRERAAMVVWARTTPVIDGAINDKSFDRYNRDVDDYNQAADRVMADLRVPVNDLHGAIRQAGPAACIVSDGVHLTGFGYTLLAGRVADALRPYLRNAN
jgi:lysophospholipase L1-like esterase